MNGLLRQAACAATALALSGCLGGGLFTDLDRSELDCSGCTGGGAGFSPYQISGLRLWHSAAAVTGVAPGNPVSSWVSEQGYGNTLTGTAAGGAPRFQATGPNGQASLRFSTATDCNIHTSGFAWGGSVYGMTIFAVARVASGTFESPLISSSSSAVATDDYCVIRSQLGGGWEFRCNRNGLGSYSVSFGSVDTAFHLHVGVWDPSLSRDGVNRLLYQVGNLYGANAAAPFASAINISAGYFYAGKTAVSADDGELAEVLVFDRALTQSEQDLVSSYLRQRYGSGI